MDRCELESINSLKTIHIPPLVLEMPLSIMHFILVSITCLLKIFFFFLMKMSQEGYPSSYQVETLVPILFSLLNETSGVTDSSKAQIKGGKCFTPTPQSCLGLAPTIHTFEITCEVVFLVFNLELLCFLM